jgi:hypothetical protein
VDDTTAINGNDMDAIASSLLEEPVEEQVEEAETAHVQDEQAEEATDADEPVDEAEEAADEADEPVDDEDEDEADEATDEEPADTLYTVKVKGVEKRVDLDELRRGYSGQQNIHQENERLAGMRKQVEAAYSQIQTEAQQLMLMRQQMEQGQVSAPPTPPNDETFKNDPIGYMEAKIDYDRKVTEWQGQQQQLSVHQQRQQQMEAQAKQVRNQEQAHILETRIPDFADPKKREVLRKQVIDAGVNIYGIPMAELNAVDSAAYVEVLHDAMRYRQMKDARNSAEQNRQPGKAPLKPGAKVSGRTSQAKKAKAAKQRMNQTGDVDSVAAFLLSK